MIHGGCCESKVNFAVKSRMAKPQSSAVTTRCVVLNPKALGEHQLPGSLSKQPIAYRQINKSKTKEN